MPQVDPPSSVLGSGVSPPPLHAATARSTSAPVADRASLDPALRGLNKDDFIGIAPHAVMDVSLDTSVREVTRDTNVQDVTRETLEVIAYDCQRAVLRSGRPEVGRTVDQIGQAVAVLCVLGPRSGRL